MNASNGTLRKIKDLNQADATKYSFARIARGAGVSSATLSRTMSGNYEGDNDAVLRKLEQYLKINQAKARGPKQIEFAMTENARLVIDVCNFSMGVGAMCMITSKAGCGKTYALEEFIRQNDNAVYIYVSQNNKRIVADLCKKMKIGIGRDGFGVAQQSLVEKLKGSNTVILVDEAHKLYHSSLEFLREIHDQCKIGIVLVGSRLLYNRITGMTALRYDGEFDQLYSRIQRYHDLDYFNVDDVSQIVKQFFPDITEELCQHILKLTGGSGRNLRNILNLAQVRGLKSPGKSELQQISEYVIMAA